MFGIHEKKLEQIIGVQILVTFFILCAVGIISYIFQLPIGACLWLEGVILLAAGGGFIVLIVNLRDRERRLEEAAMKVNSFLNGDISIRLESSDEGSLAKFFEEINHMALSLQTHLLKEKDSKEFLKSLISDISHQLKTPIAAIRMYNEIISDEANHPNTVLNFTGKTEKSLDRMECLIQSLLKITKLDAKTIVLEKREFDVISLMEEIVEEFRTVAESENKEIKVEKSVGSVLLHADRNWTAECIRNLVQNALVHMHSGNKVILSCAVTPVFIRIAVKDDGDGIHPEDIHHIFKRFYRSRFSQDSQGVGLGLALVKSIVEAQGGTVSVESVLSKGSSFYLDFPEHEVTKL